MQRRLKRSNAACPGSLNGNTSKLLEKRGETERIVTGKEAAEILRRADKLLTSHDRRQIAAGIEEARRRMAHEHLH